MGDCGVGVGFILSQKKGCRPSEICNIKGGDVYPPGAGWEDVIIALGVGRDTQSRREEFSLVGPEDTSGNELLSRVKKMADDDEQMFVS